MQGVNIFGRERERERERGREKDFWEKARGLLRQQAVYGKISKQGVEKLEDIYLANWLGKLP